MINKLLTLLMWPCRFYAVSPFKTFSAGEILTASDLNSSFTQITDNGEDLGWPATKTKDLDGNELIIDGDGDTSITADTDDVVDFRVGGTDSLKLGWQAVADTGFLNLDPLAFTADTTENTHRVAILAGNAITIPTGTTALATSLYVIEPNITATGTVTSAATVYIKDAPTEGGTNNYALWVDAGATQLDGALVVGGNYTNTTQPAFSAYNSATDTNVTGDGTVATVDFDTEIFDQGSDFAADTFTAPVTGRYLLTGTVFVNGLDAASDAITIHLVTSNQDVQVCRNDNANDMDDIYSFTFARFLDMDAADTATVTATVAGTNKTCGIVGGALATAATSFSGCLLF